MIPKTIHLCWFSDEPYPVEIKACLDSWHRYMPDYQIRRWTMADARAIGCPFIDEALECHKWAFAADVVRFYALWKEGGVYMDSDILLYRGFQELITEEGCVTFTENITPESQPSLQAAFVIASAGNAYCKALVDYYQSRHFLRADGTMDETVSPRIMAQLAQPLGMTWTETIQHLDGLTIYPTAYVAPRKKFPRTEETFARHLVNHSWRKQKLMRTIDKKMHHYYHVVKYALFRRY